MKMTLEDEDTVKTFKQAFEEPDKGKVIQVKSKEKKDCGVCARERKKIKVRVSYIYIVPNFFIIFISKIGHDIY